MRNPGDSAAICPKHNVSLENGLCPLCDHQAESEIPLPIKMQQVKRKPQKRQEEKCLGCDLPRSYCRC